MKRFTLVMLAMVFAMSMPMIATAMSHGDHSDKGKAMSEDMHKGHDMASQGDGFVEIGKDTQDGVVATVKVKTYDEKTLASMKKMGMDATHHVMVFFADEKSGKEITGGKVALKVKGKEAEPIMMMLMGTGFGADVALSGMMNTFEVGTKLDDDKKRQFSVMFHNM